jgi:hypothetical protein
MEESKILTGINIATQEIANMIVDTIYVAPDAVSVILNNLKLTPSEQAMAVDELVDRTKDWLELEEDKQHEKIEICMTQETVVKYLVENNAIRSDCYSINVGIRADDGAVVIEAMYVRLNREERRGWTKEAKRIKKLKSQSHKTVSIEGGSDSE